MQQQCVEIEERLGVLKAEFEDYVDSNRGSWLGKEAKEIGADLTVSGGYGHSRLREWIFGGVTRSLLENHSVNRLMAN